MPRRHAFTLIELLVVISIIALLIGILLPALGAARETARSITCGSGERQMGIAIFIYHEQNDGYLPVGVDRGEDGNFFAGDDNSDWAMKILNVMNPGTPTTWGDEFDRGTAQEGLARFFACPSGLDQEEGTTGSGANRIRQYGSHPRVMPNNRFPDFYINATEGKVGAMSNMRIDAIKNQSSQLLVADTTQNPNDGFNGDATLQAMDNNQIITADPWWVAGRDGIDYDRKVDLGSNQDLGNNFSQIRFRHGGNTANALILDGHVETFNYNGPTDHNLEADNLYVNF